MATNSNVLSWRQLEFTQRALCPISKEQLLHAVRRSTFSRQRWNLEHYFPAAAHTCWPSPCSGHSLTFSHGEQVAQIGGGGALGWLRAPDVPQGQEGVVVAGGEVGQAEHVVALLRVGAGAVDAAVQDLRGHRASDRAGPAPRSPGEQGPPAPTPGKPGHTTEPICVPIQRF